MRCSVGILAHVSSELCVFCLVVIMPALLRFVCGPFRRESTLDFCSLDAGGAFFGAKTPGV